MKIKALEIDQNGPEFFGLSPFAQGTRLKNGSQIEPVV